MVLKWKDPPKLKKLWFHRTSIQEKQVWPTPRHWLVSLLTNDGPKGVEHELGVGLTTVYRWIEVYGIEFETKVK